MDTTGRFSPRPYPAMVASLNSLGSVVIDVHGLFLDARFLDATGAVLDRYTVVKGSGDQIFDDGFETGDLSRWSPAGP